MKEAPPGYEWMPKGSAADRQRDVEAEELAANADIILTIALQLECKECRRKLIDTYNNHVRLVRELRDRRKRFVPILPKKQFQLVGKV